MSTLVTKRYIEDYLTLKPREQRVQFLGRALVVLFRNQTEGEKQSNVTNVDNGIGFTGADAHSGSITAKFFLKHGTLQDWQIERWTKRNRRGAMRISKYWRQLDAAAKVKRKPTQTIKETPNELDRTDTSAALVQEDPRVTAYLNRLEEKAEFARLEREQEQEAYRKKMRRDDLSRARTYSDVRCAIQDNADPRSI